MNANNVKENPLSKQIDLIFSNAVKPNFEAKISKVGDSLTSLLDDYSFFFQDNPKELLELILECYIKKYNESNNTFELDFEHFSKGVPFVSKEKLFLNVIEKVSKNLDISDIKEDKKVQDPGSNEVVLVDSDNFENLGY